MKPDAVRCSLQRGTACNNGLLHLGGGFFLFWRRNATIILTKFDMEIKKTHPFLTCFFPLIFIYIYVLYYISRSISRLILYNAFFAPDSKLALN